jgi:hypothetical protein
MALFDSSNDREARAARWRPIIVLLSAFVFLWPAVLNGGPFLFSDTVQYVRGPDSALGKLFGPDAKSEWSRPRPVIPGAPAASVKDQALVGTPRSGRSIYYGLLANLGARTGGFWLTLFLQSLASALALDLLCRALGWTRIRTFCLTVVIAAFATPLAVYACFVMPDVFAAILILAAAALAAGADRMSRTDIGVATLLVAYSAATHTSHLAIVAAAVLSAGLLFVLRLRSGASAKSPAILAAVGVVSLVAAIAAGSVFNLAVKKAFGEPPVGVPFLTARLVADHHPGEAWLQRRCPQAGFVVCRFASRLPMTSNEFLWSADPVRSVFTTASLSDQAALGRDDTRFYLTVAREEPAAVARAFVIDWADQLVDFSLQGMNVNDEQRVYLDPLLADGFRGSWERSLAYRKLWPTEAATGALAVLTLASLAALLGLAVRFVANSRSRADGEESRLLSAALVVVAGVLANAAVCGGLSGVFGRYEARVMSPLILVAGFAVVLLMRPGRQKRV